MSAKHQLLGLLTIALAVLMAACGHEHGPATAMMADMDRVRVAPGAREGEQLAPQEYGHAEHERALARKAYDDGDDVAASLYAERAIAAYQHALILARMARASTQLSAATVALQQNDEQQRTLGAARADVEREADELDKKLKIEQEAILPAVSGKADPEREAARLVAARALAMQARLLCGAARLLSPNVEGLSGVEKDLAALEAQVTIAARGAPIDAAARSRAACLGMLTKARRGTDSARTGEADALLAEIAASGGWEPSRDERGVVVTLRDAWKGLALTPEAETKLHDLGRIAAAHPTFAVQVVVHDATPPAAREATADAQRADAAVAAIVAGGASATRVKAVTAGARAPIVDPADARRRGRNARVEIVFVAPSN